MAAPFRIVGRGTRKDLETRLQHINPWEGRIGPWIRSEDGKVVPQEEESTTANHPAGYDAHPDLAEAVNTSILLRKPLLVTGNPGTGKSELAERIAWELNLGPVLRFEAQSLSEANDLFYRFDLVGQMAAAQLVQAGLISDYGNIKAPRTEKRAADPERFVTWGPLGKAILRSNPQAHHDLLPSAFPGSHELAHQPRPSVVLIDEIDKAARDFPNDLLNGIERFRYSIHELKGREIAAPDDDELRPIVLITSNSERDLPGPFLRRCTYFDIPDPEPERLARILLARVFPERYHSGTAGPAGALPKLYQDLLEFFITYRKAYRDEHVHAPGMGELIDWSRAIARSEQADETMGVKNNLAVVRSALSTLAKNREDRTRLLALFANNYGQ
jgi:MoxR-like ATPase